MTLMFLNDVIKPWDDLNSLLAQQFAFEPTLSDVTRLGKNLAIALKHQVDLNQRTLATLFGKTKLKELREAVDQESLENRLMSDIADFSKHGNLKDSGRNNDLYVASLFEYSKDKGFRFIRNALYVNHVSFGELDFLETSFTAAHYWLNKLDLQVKWNSKIREGIDEFSSSAFLYFNPKYCINMKQTRFKFFSKTSSGYIPIDPPEVKFEIFDIADQHH